MSNVLISLLALLITLGVLITVHEFGHFWVARRLGVKVLRFSIGFGRPLWLRRGRVDDTEYAIAAIPLGGYVRMLDEREGEVAAAERNRAFNRQPLAARVAIVAAGPLFNFLFAVVACSVMYMVGVTGTRPLLGEPTPDSIAAAGGFQKGDLIEAIAEQPIRTLDELALTLVERSMDGDFIQVQVRDADGRQQLRSLDLRAAQGLTEDGQLLANLGLSRFPIPAMIGRIEEGSVAARAGFQSGDRVLTINQQPIADWPQFVAFIQKRPGEPLTVLVDRAGREQILSVIPATVEDDKGVIGRIGVGGKMPEDVAEQLRIVVRYGPLEAIVAGAVKTWDMVLFTFRMLARMLVGKASLENISGPITIAQFAGQYASIGGVSFLYFLALVSISLGVINLLPVPVLDGGHLLYYLIEFIKGSPLSEAAQQLGQRIGIAVILMLMSLALFNDVVRLIE